MDMAAFGPSEKSGDSRRASHGCWESPKACGAVPRRSSVAAVQPSDDSHSYVISYALPQDRTLPYAEQASKMGAAVRGRILDGGTLLQTSERGVLYPVIHLSDHPDAVRRAQQRVFKGNAEIPLGKDFILHQGLYKEVKKVHVDKDPSAFTSPQSSTKDSKGYILIGFKSLDRNFNQLMVETWKEWTGVRSLELYLPASLGLSCIRFFLRQGSEADLFMYVVLAECASGAATPNHHMRLLDFAQRMRVERMSGYISVYRTLRLSLAPTPPPLPALAICEDPSSSGKGQLRALAGLPSIPPKVEI